MLVKIKSSLSCILSHATEILHYCTADTASKAPLHAKLNLFRTSASDKTAYKFQLEGLENYKASLLPVTTWTIIPEGEVHHQRGQFNAHPRFQNEESTEKKVCEKFRSMIKRNPEK